MTEPSPFFVTGGTLPFDSASYVVRAADAELYACLRRGEFCYVLNTRQMGKSSLMVRAARRLREDGRQVIILDLTGVGQNLSIEQWYFGLLDLVAAQTGDEDRLYEFWNTHKELGPMQRFVSALRRVLLSPDDGAQTARDLIVFVDEIDAVRSLPFSADEFFAGIRECCNRSAHDAQSGRLTFCLLGVATPSDLIRDVRVTPFNIGQRIELHDFTRQEVLPLAEGLRQGRDEMAAEALLERILYWTGGHPYMTQRLCRAVAEALAAQNGSGASGKAGGREKIEDAALVDSLCQSLFLTKEARETDDNLAFARNRLLYSEEDRAALLDLYGQIRRGKRVRNDETNALCSILRLSGVVKGVNGWLVARNEICARVFDAAWIAEHTPDAEIRRQKRAYRLGLLRAGGVFGSIALVIGVLLFIAVGNARRARDAEAEMRKQAHIAREQEQTASRLLYDVNMNQVQREWELGNFTIAYGLLQDMRGSSARGFEWDYWNRLQNEYAPPLAIKEPCYVMIAPDSRTLGIIAPDEQSPEKDRFTARDILTGVVRFSVPARHLEGQALAYSPDGRRLALCVGKTVQVRDAQNGRLMQTIPACREDPISIQFTGDGAAILVARTGGLMTLWGCRAARTLWERKLSFYDKMYIAANNKSAATLTAKSALQIWDRQTDSELDDNNRDSTHTSWNFSPYGFFNVQKLYGNNIRINENLHGTAVVAVEPVDKMHPHRFYQAGGRLMVGYEQSVRSYNTTSFRLVSALPAFNAQFRMTLTSPNGRFTLRAEGDEKFHFVRTSPITASQDLIPPPRPQRGSNSRMRRAPLGRICYAPDGRKLAVASTDGNVYLWKSGAGKRLQTLPNNGVQPNSVAFSHDSNFLAVGDSNGQVSLWDTRSRQRLVRFRAHITPNTHVPGQTGQVNAVCFTPDDRQILTGGDDFTTKMWELSQDGRTPPRLRFTLQEHKMAVESVAVSPDGAMLLTGSDDTTVRLWERRTGRLLRTYKAPTEIWGATFSPDGKRIALATLWKAVQVWDIDAPQKSRIFSGHLDAVTDVAFSPDGQRIVSGSRDHTAKVWDAQTGRELLTLRGHSGQVMGVAFAPNGRQIATSGADGVARLWNAEPGSTH